MVAEGNIFLWSWSSNEKYWFLIWLIVDFLNGVFVFTLFNFANPINNQNFVDSRFDGDCWMAEPKRSRRVHERLRRGAGVSNEEVAGSGRRYVFSLEIKCFQM